VAKKSTDKSVRQNLYEKIRDDVTYGRLVPGERLTEMDLSNRYSASRSPIREALRQLESEGLLSFERNKGIAVRKLSIKQLDELYEAMAVLEGYVVSISVGKMVKKDIATLTDIHKQLVKAAKDKDLPSWFRTNLLFHVFFRNKADNETISTLIDMLQRRTHLYQHRSVSYYHAFDSYIQNHKDIINLCKKGDAEQAEKAMRLHVQTAKQYIMESLSMHLDELL
jgi:DNA-binding GntR family transcriptional regulator